MNPSERYPVAGVGSLPFDDEEEALSHVSDAYPDLPFVPELPRLADEPRMIAGAWPRGMVVPREGRAAATVPLDEVARRLDAAAPDDVPRVAVALSRIARLRGDVVYVSFPGPVTLLMSTLESVESKEDLWRVPGLRPKAADFVARVAARLAAEVARSGRRACVVLDEPSLAPPRVDVDNTANLLLYAGVLDAVERSGGRVGMHACCEPPLDLLLHLDLAFFSVDAKRHGDRLLARKRTIERFIRRGGLLALGVFDARDAEDDLASAEAVVRAVGGASGEGIVLAPACGTGLSTPERERALAAALAALRRRLNGESS